MLNRLLLTILSIVLIASCSTGSAVDFADPSVPINIEGASVLPPKGFYWIIFAKNEDNIVFFKRGLTADSTYVASVITVEFPEMESNEQFTQEMKKLIQLEDNSERLNIILSEYKLLTDKNKLRWQFHTIKMDRLARTNSGKNLMLLEIIGNICQHPDFKKRGYIISYSHRYYDGDHDSQIWEKAIDFYEHVKFIDFNLVPNAFKTNDEAKSHYMRGLSYLEKRQFDNGIQALNRAIESDPKFSLAYNDRGYAYLNKHNYDMAIEDFSKSLKLKKSFLAYHNRGVAYRLQGKYEDAISDQTNALKLNPTKAEAHYERGLSYFNIGENNKAIDDFDLAITLEPKNDSFYEARGWAYSFNGQFNKATSNFSTAIDLNPDNDNAYSGRGDAKYKNGQLDEAILDYSKAIKINPGNENNYYNRGLAYSDKGQYDHAISDYTKAIELNPKYYQAYNNRGMVYNDKGQYDHAISDYTKAIELNPKDYQAYNNRGNIYRTKGQYDLAISDYNKAIEINNKIATAYSNRGFVYLKIGQYDQAILNYSKAIELNSKIYMVYFRRGWAYKNQGDYDKAISDYNIAIEIDGKNPLAYNNKAWILATCVDPKYRDGLKAIELSKKATELSEDIRYLDTLAAAYAETGDFADAVMTQEKVIAILKNEGKAVDDQIIKRLEFYKSNKPWRQE